MIFDEDRPIYLQIAENISSAIMQGKYKEECRIPSVREYAGEVEVNANTVMRAYEWLTARELIYNKRGIGYFVSAGAILRIAEERGHDLMENKLPPLFRLLSQLGVTPEQLAEEYRKFINEK